MTARLEKSIYTLARIMALAGGLVLTALIIVTVISVTGRAFVFAGLGPIPGDFELMEAGTADRNRRKRADAGLCHTDLLASLAGNHRQAQLWRNDLHSAVSALVGLCGQPCRRCRLRHHCALVPVAQPR